MDVEAEMEKPEERNDDEARAADEESLYLVPLGPGIPMPLDMGLALVDVKDEELRYEYGISKNPCRAKNIARANQSDQAYKDREAGRKRVLVGTRRETLKHAAVVAAVGAGATALINIALRSVGIL